MYLRLDGVRSRESAVIDGYCLDGALRQRPQSIGRSDHLGNKALYEAETLVVGHDPDPNDRLAQLLYNQSIRRKNRW